MIAGDLACIFVIISHNWFIILVDPSTSPELSSACCELEKPRSHPAPRQTPWDPLSKTNKSHQHGHSSFGFCHLIFSGINPNSNTWAYFALFCFEPANDEIELRTAASNWPHSSREESSAVPAVISVSLQVATTKEWNPWPKSQKVVNGSI